MLRLTIETPNSSAIDGIAGRYMSMDSGPIATSAPKKTIRYLCAMRPVDPATAAPEFESGMESASSDWKRSL